MPTGQPPKAKRMEKKMKAEKQKDDEILEISIGRLDGDIDFIEIRAGTTVRELISTYKSLHPEAYILDDDFVKTKHKLLFKEKVLAKKVSLRKVGIETGAHIIVHCRKVRLIPRLVDSSSSDGDDKRKRPSGFFLSTETMWDEMSTRLCMSKLHAQSSSSTLPLEIYRLPSECDSSSLHISDLEEID